MLLLEDSNLATLSGANGLIFDLAVSHGPVQVEPELHSALDLTVNWVYQFPHSQTIGFDT